VAHQVARLITADAYSRVITVVGLTNVSENILRTEHAATVAASIVSTFDAIRDEIVFAMLHGRKRVVSAKSILVIPVADADEIDVDLAASEIALMIHHQWSLICGQYINDRRTGAASLIDIYDSVRIQKIDEDEDGDPVYKPLLFSLVSDWRADSREDVGSARIRVFQDGRETAVSESTTLELTRGVVQERSRSSR